MNGRTIKLKNRRVSVGRYENGDVFLEFKRLKKADEEGDSRVTITHIRLSPAAAVALYSLLIKELDLKDLALFEKEIENYGRTKKNM